MELEEVLLDLTGFPPHVKTTKISKKMKDLFWKWLKESLQVLIILQPVRIFLHCAIKATPLESGSKLNTLQLAE